MSPRNIFKKIGALLAPIQKYRDTFSVTKRIVIAILLAFLLSAGLIILQGVNPIDAYLAIIKGSLGSKAAIANTTVRAAPLLLAGLGISLGIRAGLFNIGAEGQIYIGAALATAIGITPLPVPPALHMTLAVTGGFIGGAIMAALPAYLRAYRDVNEVVVTLMLNYIGIYLVGFLLQDTFLAASDAAYPQSPTLLKSALLPRILPGTSMHAGILLGIALAIVLFFVLKYSAFGFRVRMIGSNPNAAKYAGINVKFNLFVTMLVVGGLAGLAGAGEILGVKYALFDRFSGGLGYDAISVAVLGGSNPLGIIISSLFIGTLRAGAGLMQQTTGIQKYMADVIQAIVILFVIGIGFTNIQSRKACEEKKPINTEEHFES